MTIFRVARVGVGLFFALSGYLKLLEPTANFRAAVESYRILQGEPALWFARALPWIELIFGVYLAIGLWKRLSLGVLWTINTVFIVALVSVFWRGIAIQDCGCFGQSLFSFTPGHMLVNDIFLWFLFLMLFLNRKGEAI
ncbi:MAG: DoxX family membrane protein [Candidatus Omnitrophica bacterium]|nr:DoxX family membrane protein [Candidatus Omnitrophota bacterium]